MAFRLLRTARHLSIGQILARARHAAWLRRRKKIAWPEPDVEVKFNKVRIAPPPPEGVKRYKAIAELWQRGRVEYLSEAGENADWRAWHKSKLWRYERHYHAELVALAIMSLEDPGGPWAPAARELVEGWATEVPPYAGDAWEPYPTARRVLNWSEAAALEPQITPGMAPRLAFQLAHLLGHLERHLRGNHLLCDAAALVAGGSLLSGSGSLEALHVGTVLLEDELKRQVLPDGGFAERSVQYHATVLRDALLALQLARERGQPPSIKDELSRMARWLVRTRRPDGSWPHLNDSSPAIVPVAQDAIRRAVRLGLLDGALGSEPEGLVELPDTGWTLVREAGTELLFDRGPIGPPDNPGHGHADALSYELIWGGIPLVTDTGVSTYDEGAVRTYERSSAAHACVTVDAHGTDEVWKSFRVGRRAKVTSVPQAAPDNRVKVLRGRAKAHGFVHERALLLWAGRAFVVFDRITGARPGSEVLDHVPLDPAWSGAEVGGVLFLLGPRARGVQLHVPVGKLRDQLRGVVEPYAGFSAQGFGKTTPRSVARIEPDERGLCIYAFLAPEIGIRVTDTSCNLRASGAEVQLTLDRGLPAAPKA